MPTTMFPFCVGRKSEQMTGFWNPVWAFIQAFFRAWSTALVSGLPPKMQRALLVVEEPVLIKVEALGEGENKILSVAADKEIRFELNEELILRHEMLIPVAAIQDAKNIVQLEAERIMPLAVNKLSVCYKVADVFNRDFVPIEIIATRETTINMLLERCKKLGRNIHSITSPPVDGKLPISFSVSSIKRRKLLRATLIVSSLSFMIVSLSTLPQLYQSRLLEEITHIDLQIRETRRQTDAIAGLQRQVQALKGISDAVQEKKDRAHITELLIQLTQASPDDIVLDIFRIDGRRVFVSGIADAPENWVIELEQNLAFENVVLSSVRGGEDSLTRRFEVRFDVLWPAYREET